MADHIRTFVALEKGIGREEVQRSLPAPGGDVEVVEMAEGLDKAWLALHETPADLLLIACSGFSEELLTLVGGAVRERPSRPVVVFAHGASNGLTRKLFAAGADDVVMFPADPRDVSFVLHKAVARKAGASEAALHAGGSLICVLGPKGGTGKTLTATCLALALAEAGTRVAIVDLDLQFGDVGLFMGIAPRTTMYDLVRSGGELDAEKLDAFLITHESGVRVLLAPSRPDQAAVVSIEFLREVYAVLRGMVDYVVVDTPPGFTPEVIATIDSATTICMVGMLDALSLKNVKLGIETLDLMGFPRERVRLVLNRAGSRVGISDDDVLAIMGTKPDVLVPSDREIPRALNAGMPIFAAKPRSEAAEAFRKLASLVSEGAVVEQPASGRRHRLMRRS
jgi:pilus assembly protein CpaE